MVRVLANGDVVPDDDPRVAQQRPNTASGRRVTGGNVHSTPAPQANAANQMGQTTSVFESINNRLRALGVPSWNAGPYTVEPIVSLGFLLALLFMGIQGLIFAALLFFIVKYSGVKIDNGRNAPQADAAQARRTISVFDYLNRRLIAAGVPSLSVGPCIIEPIFSVTFLLTLLFMWINGIGFAPILFIINYSGVKE